MSTASAKERQCPGFPSITKKDQVAAKDHATFDSIVASRGAVQGPFTMFLHSPEIAGRVAHLGAYVRFEGSLDMRVRVLAAMTVAREYEAMYVWGAQTGGARRLGVPESTITAIRENHTRGVPPEDAQIIDFTRALLRKHRVDAATFKAMQDRFGNDELVQLTTAIGYYSLLCDDGERLRARSGARRRSPQGLEGCHCEERRDEAIFRASINRREIASRSLSWAAGARPSPGSQ